MSLKELVGWQNGKHYYLIVIGVFLMSFLLYAGWMARYIGSDIYLHYQLIMGIIRMEQLPPAYFLYYLTIALLSFWQPERLVVAGVIAVVLSAAVTVKYLLTHHFLMEDGQKYSIKNKLLLAGITVLLLFAFSLPGPDVYLTGKLPPNIWHNSTLVFLMPFAMVLFLTSLRYLETGKKRYIWHMSFWAVLNVLAKPSFFLCFVCAFPVLVFLKHGWGRIGMNSLIPLILGGGVLMLEYFAIYLLVPQLTGEGSTSLIIRPFYVWNYLAKGNIMWSWIASVAFPLACLIAFPGWMRELPMQYVLLLTGAGLLLFILWVEAGPREFHGNFSWQLIVCHFLWFWISVKYLLREIQLKSRHRLIFSGLGFLFIAHVISGILYLSEVFRVGTAYV